MIDADGLHRCGLRVFCDVRNRSVSLDVCRECPCCVAINGETDGKGCVRCSPSLDVTPTALAPSGGALRRGVVAVDGAVLVRDIVPLFVERGVRMVVVIDAAGRAEGVVHESQLIRQIQDYAHDRAHATRLGWKSAPQGTASAIMFPAPMVLEDVPLRAALAAMASAHQRQLVVVDEQGLPVGTLVDVDALHASYTGAHERDE